MLDAHVVHFPRIFCKVSRGGLLLETLHTEMLDFALLDILTFVASAEVADEEPM